MAKALEQKSGFDELATQNETLVSEVKVLRSELEVATKELERLLQEQAERKEKESEISDAQFLILKALAPKEVSKITVYELSQKVTAIQSDELALHLGILKELKYISRSHNAMSVELPPVT